MAERMKFVVPLTMPWMEDTRSEASASRRVRMMGMPPQTAPSKCRSTPRASAWEKSASPCAVSSALLAVTTLRPEAMARSR